jgi:hypothetical protein
MSHGKEKVHLLPALAAEGRKAGSAAESGHE